MNDVNEQHACSQQRYEVQYNDLPLSCPMPNVTLWDGHPKVYLDVKGKDEVMCPYCGAKYVLIDG
jgi:uncharacterized Zn-finger protein